MAKMALGFAALLAATTVTTTAWSQIAEPPKISQAASGEKPQWELDLHKELQKKITVKFKETTVVEALHFLQSFTNGSIITLPKAQLKLKLGISLIATEQTLDDALRIILKSANLEMTLMDGAIVIGAKNEAASLSKQMMKVADPAMKKILSKPLSCELTGTPLADVVQFVAETAGLKISLSQKIKANTAITLRIKNMATEHALRWIARLADATCVVRDQDIVLEPLGTVAPRKPDGF